MKPALVTGAAGKTGVAVIRALVARGAAVRAAIRRAEQELVVAEAGATEAQVVDLADREALSAAMTGAGAVYFICPNMHPDEAELGARAIRAAECAAVDRFVYHSVLHPQAEAMPHHWQKLRVEEALFESDLQWTILQPTAYMQNMLGAWAEAAGGGDFRVPYPVTSRIALVALEDVAEAAAKVMIETGHSGATYELVGTGPMAQTEVARHLAEALGRPVRAVEVARAETRSDLQARGLSGYEIASLLKMFDYYGRHGLKGSPNVLRWLLGRQPTTLAEFVQERANDAVE